MVDTQEYLEGPYLTYELVNKSPTKKCVIIGEPKGEDTKFGAKLTANVQIDGKNKIWRMNRDSVKNLRLVNTDSKFWNGITVILQPVTVSGKDTVTGRAENLPNNSEIQEEAPELVK